ncbi:MAG TPA: hypothetical protein VE975_05695 [Actinomycetota bacterium]|jgi:hypothetical protein|nr:hypothetical protein [Actinomycetota bacterium]
MKRKGTRRLRRLGAQERGQGRRRPEVEPAGHERADARGVEQGRSAHGHRETAGSERHPARGARPERKEGSHWWVWLLVILAIAAVVVIFFISRANALPTLALSGAILFPKACARGDLIPARKPNMWFALRARKR